MHEVAPTDRADLTGAQGTGDRERAEEPVDEPGVVVGRAEEVLPAPVAREQERAARVVAGEQRPKIFVGRGGVAHVELHRLAHAHFVPDRKRAGLGVRSHDVSHEEVAASELRLVLVDDETNVQPVTDQLAVFVARFRCAGLEPRQRGLPGELFDAVPLGAGDHERATERTAPLRHHRADLDAVDQNPDGTDCVDAIVEHETVTTRSAGGGRGAADHLEAGSNFVELPKEPVGGEAEGIGEEDEGPRIVVELRPPGDRLAVRSGFEGEGHRGQPRLGHPRGEERHCGAVLDLVRATDDRYGGRADEDARLEEVAERERKVVERAHEMRRHEAHDEVGVLAFECFENLARGFTDRMRGDRMLREGGRVLRHRGIVRGFSDRPNRRPGVTGARAIPPIGSPIPWPPPTCSRRPIRPSSSPGTESRSPSRGACAQPDEAVAAAEQVGYPVVVKLNGARIAHKTERGLVRLDLADAAAVRDASTALLAAARPDDGDVDLLVARMVTGVRELIAGLHTDPQFGRCVMVGVGGVLTEALADVTFRLAPIDAADAADMLDELRSQALLGPLRGEPAVDRAALGDVLLALSRVAESEPNVVSVDLNPLVVDHGTPIAVDALVETT